jgi:hypothetical protein
VETHTNFQPVWCHGAGNGAPEAVLQRCLAANPPVGGRAPGSAFFYLDLNDTVRRAVLFTAAVRDVLPTAASLKPEYARALAQLTDAPLNTSGHPQVVSGGPILTITRAKGLNDVAVRRPPSYGPRAQAIAVRHVRHSLLFLRAQHPPLCELCDLLITDILCWPGRELRGGSTERLPGIVWLAPAGHLTTLDIAEFVIHEMVHMNVHLADMTFGLFNRARPHYFKAHSAVLGRSRPYYQAFHSACVAVALIYFRLLVGLHGEIAGLRASLERCTCELLAHRLAPAAFTKNAWNAMRAANAFGREPTLAAIPVHQSLVRLA